MFVDHRIRCFFFLFIYFVSAEKEEHEVKLMSNEIMSFTMKKISILEIFFIHHSTIQHIEFNEFRSILLTIVLI